MYSPTLAFLKATAVCLVAAASLTSTARAVPSAAREWNEELLAAIRRNVPNPPAHARNRLLTRAVLHPTASNGKLCAVNSSARLMWRKIH